MIFQKTWDRFTADWKTFAIIAVGPLIAYLVMLVIMCSVGLLTGVSLAIFAPNLEYAMDEPSAAMIGQFMSLGVWFKSAPLGVEKCDLEQ